MDQQTREIVIHQISSLSKIELLQLFMEALQETKDKIEFYDSVADSKDMIEMSAVAKVLNIPGYGRNKIFEILRQKKILRWNNEPYQEFVDREYFKLIEQKVTLPYGEIKINRKPVVSQKGIDFIRRIINEQ
jgi:anti-repressor protein